jgi:SH3-like domain-containing protein
LFLSIFAFSFAFQQSREPDAAIVITGSINVKSAPRNSGKDLFILHEGSKLWLLDELEGWKEIRIVDGRKGWISDYGIEKI